MRSKTILLMASLVSTVMMPIIAVAEPVAAAVNTHKLCGAVPKYTARCYATAITDGGGITPLSSTTPVGYGPSDFKLAYRNHGSTSAHIAIVSAYDAPHIQSDLSNFSKQFGLRDLPTCTSFEQSACFEKLNQHGATAYPRADSSWALETSMDAETVHGQCPTCRITLIEASTPSIDNLSAAASEASSLGARIVSNSYGGSEASGEVAYDHYYRKTGVTFVVSSGDSGYGTSYPAASPNVIAVGGTSLRLNGSRLMSETAWNGSGSGCSQFEYKPTWQHDKKCTMRSIADVAADADPATGAAIYDSYSVGGRSGWFTVGGTSLAAPLVSGILAANGDAGIQPANLYSGVVGLRDIIAGTNGTCNTYLCKSTNGYDGPTGLGVLNRP